MVINIQLNIIKFVWILKNFKFFSCNNRKQLGDKKSLGQKIHMVTNIPLFALEGDRLSRFSVMLNSDLLRGWRGRFC